VLQALVRSVGVYSEAAEAVDEEAGAWLSLRGRGRGGEGGLGLEGEWSEARLACLNDRLALTERRFLAKGGLPDRKYFKHVLQAPGLELGYGATVFPGVVEACGEGDWEVAQQQASVAARHVLAAAHFLRGPSWGEDSRSHDSLVAAA
jgi:hypothetical protein